MAYYSFTERMLKGERIPVFAREELYRDFTYIDDVVEGVVRLLFKPQSRTPDRPAHAIFNIGNYLPVRVTDFIAILERVLNVKADMELLPMQQGDVPVTCAYMGRLREWVNFAPTTSLEDGLIRFRDWYCEWIGQRVSAVCQTSSARQAGVSQA